MIVVFQTISGLWMMGEVTPKRSVNGGSPELEMKPVHVKNPRLIRYTKGGVTGSVTADFEHVDIVNKPESIYAIMALWFPASKDYIDQYKDHVNGKDVHSKLLKNSEGPQPPQHHSQVS